MSLPVPTLSLLILLFGKTEKGQKCGDGSRQKRKKKGTRADFVQRPAAGFWARGTRYTLTKTFSKIATTTFSVQRLKPPNDKRTAGKERDGDFFPLLLFEELKK